MMVLYFFPPVTDLKKSIVTHDNFNFVNICNSKSWLHYLLATLLKAGTHQANNGELGTLETICIVGAICFHICFFGLTQHVEPALCLLVKEIVVEIHPW